MKLKVEKEVSKETYELGMALAKIVDGVKVALGDGWQVGSDLPVIMTALISNLGEAVEGVRAAQDELAEDPEAFINAIAFTLAGMYKSLKG